MCLAIESEFLFDLKRLKFFFAVSFLLRLAKKCANLFLKSFNFSFSKRNQNFRNYTNSFHFCFIHHPRPFIPSLPHVIVNQYFIENVVQCLSHGPRLKQSKIISSLNSSSIARNAFELLRFFINFISCRMRPIDHSGLGEFIFN